MRQTDLAGPGAQSAANQSRQRGRVVRVAKRQLMQQLAAAQPPGNRLDHAQLQRLRNYVAVSPRLSLDSSPLKSLLAPLPL